MRKIMFNDEYGLTAAVLERRKTMTRRMESGMENLEEGNFCFLKYKKEIELYGEKGTIIETIKPRYKVGEVVAVAQNYQDVYEELKRTHGSSSSVTREFFHKYVQGGRMPVSNKMFVRADLMPHQIQITDIKMERLQDISEEDAMREGIFKYDKPPLHHECDPFAPWPPYVKPYKHDNDNLKYRCSARYAFADLIDKVSGKGTWDSNPWVFAYELKLVK